MDDLSSDLASLKIDRGPVREQRSGLRRLAVWLLALLLLVGLLVWAYPRMEAQLFKREVKTSTIVEVSPSLAVTNLTATGYVIAERRSKVGANVAGRIARLHVREGSRVKQGDLLIELDADDQKGNVAAAQARMAAAEAKVPAARARLAELKMQLDRQRGLLMMKAAARSVVEDLESRVATAAAEIEGAQAEVRSAAAQVALAKVALGRMTIIAPIDGTVLDKPLDIGEAVEPAEPLLELADLGSLVIEIDVPEARLSLVKVDDPTEVVLDAFAGKRFAGRVREIGMRVNRAKATVPVKVALSGDATGVLPDMSARVSFLSEPLDSARAAEAAKLVVPAAAVAERDGRSVVFAIADSTARQREVELGPKSGDGIELLRGPAAGTRVVINPDADLADGQRVKERTQ